MRYSPPPSRTTRMILQGEKLHSGLLLSALCFSPSRILGIVVVKKGKISNDNLTRLNQFQSILIEEKAPHLVTRSLCGCSS